MSSSVTCTTTSSHQHSKVQNHPIEKKFQIGDKVMITNLNVPCTRGSSHIGKIGHVGIIKSISSDGYHELEPSCSGHSWRAECLTLVYELEKVGEKVGEKISNLFEEKLKTTKIRESL